MEKNLAIIFPGIGYSVERPLLYYSKMVLEENGYEVVSVNYTGLEQEKIFELPEEKLIINGAPDNRDASERVLSFVAKAKELARSQLSGLDFTKYDRLIFVSKSIGTIVGAICAKQIGINPYHIMITPIDYAFQFIENGNGSIFCGQNDPMVNYEGLNSMCKDKEWDFHSFKSCNHFLETGSTDLNVDHLKRFVSIVSSIVSDMEDSIYDYDVACRNQNKKSMSQYKGKVLLIVNTATGCGFTPQYKLLEEIYNKYKHQGFEILDFPCNQFNNQAPGTEEEIYYFCTSRYDITFEQFAKICVNGEKQSELYRFLKARKGFKGFDMSKPDSKFLIHKLEKDEPGYELSSDIKWNFTKFLVNRKGQVIERFEPTTDLTLVENSILQLL